MGDRGALCGPNMTGARVRSATLSAALAEPEIRSSTILIVRGAFVCVMKPSSNVLICRYRFEPISCGQLRQELVIQAKARFR